MEINEAMDFGADEVFPNPIDLGSRDWGLETLLGLVPGRFSFKRLFMRAGSKGGLQFHQLKEEIQILISGEMIIRTVGKDGNLTERVISAGDVMHFRPGTVHQEEAVTDCLIIEASTPHFNDRVRVETMYGFSGAGGLPTTDISDVYEL